MTSDPTWAERRISFEASSFEAASFEASSFEASSVEAASFEAASRPAPPRPTPPRPVPPRPASPRPTPPHLASPRPASPRPTMPRQSGSFRTGSEEHSDPVRDLLGSVLGARGQEPGTSGPGPGARPRRPQPLNLRSLPGCLARGISRNIFLYPLVLNP
jgi:hypothetical protein